MRKQSGENLLSPLSQLVREYIGQPNNMQRAKYNSDGSYTLSIDTGPYESMDVEYDRTPKGIVGVVVTATERGSHRQKLISQISFAPYRGVTRNGLINWEEIGPGGKSYGSKELPWQGDDQYRVSVREFMILKKKLFMKVHRDVEDFIKKAASKMSSLREEVIRIASDHPELRKHLVPILKEANLPYTLYMDVVCKKSSKLLLLSFYLVKYLDFTDHTRLFVILADKCMKDVARVTGGRAKSISGDITHSEDSKGRMVYKIQPPVVIHEIDLGMYDDLKHQMKDSLKMAARIHGFKLRSFKVV